jgi:uncharacterized membrane protein YhaH (DUF805 family)
MEQQKAIGFGKAIGNFYAKYAIFSGRATRSEFWYSWLYLLLLYLVLVAPSTFSDSVSAQFIGTVVLFSIVGVAHILPSLSIQARRLRDAGFSPYLVLLLLAPFGGLVLFVLALFPSKPVAEQTIDVSSQKSQGIEAELKKLDELHEQGLIDDQQLKEAKNKALGI